MYNIGTLVHWYIGILTYNNSTLHSIYHLPRNSFKEFETASKVGELLIEYCGIPAEQIFHNVGKTGVVAIIQALKWIYIINQLHTF